jgi:hypothetical protein
MRIVVELVVSAGNNANASNTPPRPTRPASSSPSPPALYSLNTASGASFRVSTTHPANDAFGASSCTRSTSKSLPYSLSAQSMTVVHDDAFPSSSRSARAARVDDSRRVEDDRVGDIRLHVDVDVDVDAMTTSLRVIGAREK